ncbi:MarR family winged helix-turn-helix transcriptional regulator [Desertibacillus haloalkaliphilus]|uniref:MarR family winged helix-turn-helix transcriptional regulator n=1 Tax=Desertibacillus haloalkaliphilus TaxID=1328930 RepID=UPI001C270DA0|nr:MarR family transcriptional regulator [Desertibacillus haloalkaliphilus]MBU8906807.1 MarR family transcriptional regulator [Desertibacillus haloalkaliphilus]
MKLSFKDYISIFIHQTDLHLTSFVKTKLAPFNIAPEQNLVMMLLWERDGQSQNEISRQLDKDKTNVARMAYNLEQKGYITRKCCENDRRTQRLHLTESGRKLGDSVIPITEEFNETVRQGITDEELAEVKRILSKMRENVQ